MPITQPNAGTGAAVGSGQLTATYPTVSAGDLCILVCYSRVAATFGTSGAVTGWTAYGTPSSSATYGSLSVWTRRMADGTLSGTTFTIANTGTDTSCVGIVALRGVYGSTASDGFATASANSVTQQAAGADRSDAGITPLYAHSAVVYIVGNLDGTAANNWSSWTGGNIATWNEAVDVGSTTGGDASIGIAWGIKTAATATETLTVTGTANADLAGSQFVLALRKAVETVTGVFENGTTVGSDESSAPVYGRVMQEGVTATETSTGQLATRIPPYIDAVSSAINVGDTLTVTGISHWILRLGEGATATDEHNYTYYQASAGPWTGNWLFEEGATATDGRDVRTSANLLQEEGATATDDRAVRTSAGILQQEGATATDDRALQVAASALQQEGSTTAEGLDVRTIANLLQEEGTTETDDYTWSAKWVGNWLFQEGTTATDSSDVRTSAGILQQEGTTATDGSDVHAIKNASQGEGVTVTDAVAYTYAPATAAINWIFEEGATATSAEEGQLVTRMVPYVDAVSSAINVGDTLTVTGISHWILRLGEGSTVTDASSYAPYIGIVEQEGTTASESGAVRVAAAVGLGEGVTATDEHTHTYIRNGEVAWTFGESSTTDTALAVKTIADVVQSEGVTATDGYGYSIASVWSGLVEEASTVADGMLSGIRFPKELSEFATVGDEHASAWVDNSTPAPYVLEIAWSLNVGEILVVRGVTEQVVSISQESAATGDTMRSSAVFAQRLGEGTTCTDTFSGTFSGAIDLPTTLYPLDAQVVTATAVGNELVFDVTQYAEYAVDTGAGGDFTVILTYDAPFGATLVMKDKIPDVELARWTALLDPVFSEEEEEGA